MDRDGGTKELVVVRVPDGRKWDVKECIEDDAVWKIDVDVVVHERRELQSNG